MSVDELCDCFERLETLEAQESSNKPDRNPKRTTTSLSTVNIKPKESRNMKSFAKPVRITAGHPRCATLMVPPIVRLNATKTVTIAKPMKNPGLTKVTKSPSPNLSQRQLGKNLSAVSASGMSLIVTTPDRMIACLTV